MLIIVFYILTMADSLASYDYLEFTLNGVQLILDPEEVNISDDTSKEVSVHTKGRPTYQATKKSVELTAPGLNRQQASALIASKRADAQAMINGTKTYDDLTLGAFILRQTYVKNINPKAPFFSYNLAVQEVSLTVCSAIYE